MKVGKIELKNNLILAPMQNVTTAPYRRFCRKFSTIGLVSVPMIYIKRIEKHPSSILIDLYKIEEERPISVQLIGGDEKSLKKAIDFLSSYQFDFLDINAGCPSRRAIKAQEGGYLLKDLNKLKKILDTSVKFSSKPVSVKIRTGYNSTNYLLDITKIIEDSGVELVSLHSRTIKDRYDDSKFDLESLKLLKKQLSIPIIGNGDINSPQRAKQIINDTKVDGLMIGRASMGNPQIFSQIANFLNHEIKSPLKKNLIKLQELIGLYENIIDKIDYSAYFSNELELNQFKFTELKRNTIWLTKYIANSKMLRIRLSKSKSLKELRSILTSTFQKSSESSGVDRNKAI